MQHPPDKALDHWPDGFEVSAPSTSAEGDPWNELFAAREALLATQEKEARLLQLLVEARELLLEFQGQTAAAEARASEAERRAEAAELQLRAKPELANAQPARDLDVYATELNRLRAMFKIAEEER